MGCVPFNVPPKNRNVAGDFHRPYGGRVPFIEGAGIWCVTKKPPAGVGQEVGGVI